MTIHQPTHANKAAGYENNDAVDALRYSLTQTPAEQFECNAEPVKPLIVQWMDKKEEEKKYLTFLETRHGEDTETIHQLQLQLKQEKERGNNFCDRMIAAERLYREENAKVVNLQAELRKSDEALLKYAAMEDYLFQTMELAKDQREKYLRECGELDE